MITTTTLRIPSSQVPESVINGELGKYPLDKDQYINKGIDIFDGWRYCIGIKDISVYNYQFAEKSEMITKPFVTTKPIKEVSLFANEVIPEIFTQDLTKANDWIQYFISIDDINWHRISPMHQQPIAGKTDFPPKVYRINSKEVIEDKIENPLYGYIYTDGDVYGIRLKVIIRRPTDIENSANYTPILEDYSLRIALEDSFLKGGLI
jgi:hypothetical protein